MSIREKFKKKQQDVRTLVQVKIDPELLVDVDSQIEIDVKNGFELDRTILITACLQNYLQESKKAKK